MLFSSCDRRVGLCSNAFREGVPHLFTASSSGEEEEDEDEEEDEEEEATEAPPSELNFAFFL